MKKNFLLILSVLLVYTGMAQNQNSIIKAAAMDMARALLKKDYNTFTRYMLPEVIRMAGGKEKLSAKMDSANAMAKQFGAEISKVTIGNPGPIINYKKQLQVIVPQTTELTSGFGNVILETSLLGISDDGGKNWYFVDTSVYNVNDIKKAFPSLSPELVIPPAKQPKFIQAAK